MPRQETQSFRESVHRFREDEALRGRIDDVVKKARLAELVAILFLLCGVQEHEKVQLRSFFSERALNMFDC